MKRTCWWLDEKWGNKNLNQQVTLEYAGTRIDVYNFSNVFLEQWQFEVLRHWMASLLQFSIGIILHKIQYILIDDVDTINPFNGQNKWGTIDQDKKAIIIHPSGLSEEKYRFGDFSCWEGILWHESAHWLEPGFFHRIQWMKKFGWIELEKPIKSASGFDLYYQCIQPERCVDEYATLNVADDYAESFVACCFCPEILDGEKFIELSSKMLMKKKIYPIQIDIRDRRGSDIVYPFLSQPLFFKRREGVRIVRK